MESHGRSWKVKEGQEMSRMDFGFGTWIWDLDLGLGFWTWILDLDLGLDLGLTTVNRHLIIEEVLEGHRRS